MLLPPLRTKLSFPAWFISPHPLRCVVSYKMDFRNFQMYFKNEQWSSGSEKWKKNNNKKLKRRLSWLLWYRVERTGERGRNERQQWWRGCRKEEELGIGNEWVSDCLTSSLKGERKVWRREEVSVVLPQKPNDSHLYFLHLFIFEFFIYFKFFLASLYFSPFLGLIWKLFSSRKWQP